VTLTHSQARDFYDGFGKRQDAQFYEEVAITRLLERASFEQAESIFEFGCGTGRFAAELLEDVASDSVTYKGIDISSTMVALAQMRLTKYGARVQVDISDGKPVIREESDAFDRFISNYVLDLLDQDDIETVLNEAHRVLKPGGLICLISLTHGISIVGRLVESIWASLYRMKPSLVGGCRPIRLGEFVGSPKWRVEYVQSVSSFGITSEILIAEKL
jgi:ubiquinone/menaquinone biosynthesis C-methylase UbiE